MSKIYLMIFILLFYLSGCVPEKDSPEKGTILENRKENGRVISYLDKNDIEMEKVETFKEE